MLLTLYISKPNKHLPHHQSNRVLSFKANKLHSPSENMARSVSSNEGSPLSSLSSEPFDADDDQERTAEAGMPPAKRQRIGNSSMRATPPPNPPFDEVQSCISSDTDGEFPMPSSPNNTRPDDDDNHEQVTVCVWDGCEAGDLGDMDALVEHIHNEHIETRQKKYTCEWSDCTRKSMTHASGYALKAHMRSHTREKPFLCSLPGKKAPRRNCHECADLALRMRPSFHTL